jgi:hypothetical protein
MKFLILFLVALTVLAARTPEVQIVDVKVRRVEEGRVAVDGHVRVTGEKAVHGLTVVFDFLSADDAPLTTLKTEVDDDPVNAGEESSFHAVTMNPPGAVKYKLRVFNSDDKQLRAGNTGPFIIE